MFGRGRLDHFGFTVVDQAALRSVRDRLLAAGATSGDIRPLGPMLSVRFQDPDGLRVRSAATTRTSTPRRSG